MGIVKNLAGVLFGTALVSIPIIFPIIPVLLFIFVWIPVYLYIFIESFFYTPESSLPWIVSTYNVGLLTLLAFSLIGFVAGFSGYVSTVLFWVPPLYMKTFICMMGLGVLNVHDWTGYKLDNYDFNHCPTISEWRSPDSPHCFLTPKLGKHLPSFSIGDDDKPYDVIPYKG